MAKEHLDISLEYPQTGFLKSISEAPGSANLKGWISSGFGAELKYIS
ncbi:MAG: hypothetical protein Ct9H300mP11_09350 [Chloroflexota bacterium]|nr:MAG: hypothetical protein Ct9H300mP11_09350 [Chloroflexota bacterium]